MGLRKTVHTEIHGCKLVVDCPKQWEELALIHGTPAVRFCGDCKTAVHLATEEPVQEHVSKGHCVALQYEAYSTLGSWVSMDGEPRPED